MLLKPNVILVCRALLASIGAVTEASLHVLQPLPTISEADIGSNFTLNCNVIGHPHPHVKWLKDGHSLTPDLSWKVHEKKGKLVSRALRAADAGNYTCIADNFIELEELNTHLIVKTTPAKLANVTVHPSTVVATIRWHVISDGGYPILSFTLLYQPYPYNVSIDWHKPRSIPISPAARQIFVYHLHPDTEYMFRMWATNRLGPGEQEVVRAYTSKPTDPAEVVQHMLTDTDGFSSTCWMIAVSVVMGTVLLLSCLSCILIYKEGRRLDIVEEPHDIIPHIITNPGFDIDLEERYLLQFADYNDNTERPIRINNNTVVQPPGGM